MKVLQNGISRCEPLNVVGTARCAVRAAYQRRKAGYGSHDERHPIPPAGTRAGTSQRDVPTSSRFMGRIARPGSSSGFTMVEIALCLAIVGFALVAIIGVLPAGMNVQRDNRAETIINQDAAVWMDAIRNGAEGYDDLTNYVSTILVTSNGVSYTYNQSMLSAGFGGGAARILRLLSLPKYTSVNGVDYTNSIVVLARAMSGAAVEKPPQSNPELESMAFSYRMVVENTDIPIDLGFTNATTAALMRNSRELRLLFRWPLLPNGVGNGRQTYRTLIGGRTIAGRDGGPLFQPSTYERP